MKWIARTFLLAFGIISFLTCFTSQSLATTASKSVFAPSVGVYLNPNTGRFWSMDLYDGSSEDPLSLHKYLYCQGNPIMMNDPSGHDGDSITMMVVTGISVGMNAYNAYSDIKAKRYAWAAVDILSALGGMAGMGGPGLFSKVACAGSGVSVSTSVASIMAKGAMQVSQAWAVIDLFMQSTSMSGGSGGDGSPKSSGSGSSSTPEKVTLEKNDAAIGLVKDGKIVKWAKYSDYPDYRTAPSHERLAMAMSLLKQPGALEDGVEAFTVGKRSDGTLIFRGSGNFNEQVSAETLALLQQMFQ
jgi:hypothetical protein